MVDFFMRLWERREITRNTKYVYKIFKVQRLYVAKQRKAIFYQGTFLITFLKIWTWMKIHLRSSDERVNY